MTHDELEARVAELSKFCSALLGEQHALKAATLGFLTLAGRVPEARAAVDHHLEKTYATMLADNTNQVGMEAFEATAELIRLAMDVHIELAAAADRGTEAPKL